MTKKRPDYKPPILAYVSGGRDSTAMVHLLVDEGYHVEEMIFVDTGWDFPWVHDHLADLSNRTGVPLRTIRTEKPLTWFLLEHEVKHRTKWKRRDYGWPWVWRRWCHSQKEKAIRHDAIARYGRGRYSSAVGLHADEKRGKMPDHVITPLRDFGWGIREIQARCDKEGYTFDGLYEYDVRVSCFCCPLQPKRALRLTRQKYPELWKKMLAWDDQLREQHGGMYMGFAGFSSLREADAKFAGLGPLDPVRR